MSLKYVLITPARNEAAYIEQTILSVVAQSVLPEKWVIVSDASDDGTDEIVSRYARDHAWLEYVRLESGADRHFASKVRTFNAGFEIVKNTEYEIIGNIDADVSFESDYMEFLLEQLQNDPELGVVGTDYVEGEFHSYRDSYINEEHVNGQCQLFRRACFEVIGGYTPIPHGGIDWVAVTSARMKGWKTRSFHDKVFHHLRIMGSEGKSILRVRWDYGKKDYFLGNHPVWELMRGVFQMKHYPFVVGGLLLLAGYGWCWIRMEKRPISRELLRFNRSEQLSRMKGMFSLRRRDSHHSAGE